MTPKASHSPGSIPVWLRDTRWHGRHARSPHREDGRELLTEAHAAQATGAPLIDIRGRNGAAIRRAGRRTRLTVRTL
jgi:hypothetical protein